MNLSFFYSDESVSMIRPINLINYAGLFLQHTAKTATRPSVPATLNRKETNLFATDKFSK